MMWKSKTLEQLLNRKVNLMRQEENSYLIVTCNNLYKKEINLFEVEDLRIMISQNIGLQYLVPLAFEVLEQNIFAEGDFYEGDLLKSVLTSDRNYWLSETDRKKDVIKLWKRNKQKILQFDTTKEIREGLTEAFKLFKQI